MGRKRDRTGIAGFFDEFERDSSKPEAIETKQGRQPAAKPTKKPRKKQSVKPDTDRPNATRTPTATGRPRGKKDGEGPLRTRSTLWIADDLMEAYRKRTWEEHCRLGELVERALREYMERNWGEREEKT